MEKTSQLISHFNPVESVLDHNTVHSLRVRRNECMLNLLCIVNMSIFIDTKPIIAPSHVIDFAVAVLQRKHQYMSIYSSEIEF